MFIRFMLFVMLSLVANFAHAESQIPQRTLTAVSMPELSLGLSLAYFRDPQHKLTAEQILNDLSRWPWHVSDEDVPNLGLVADNVWFATRIQNIHQTSEHSLLEIGYSKLDLAELMVVRNGTIVKRQAFGDQLPFASRPILHRQFLMHLTFPPRSETLLLIKVRTSGAVQMPLTLWQPDAFLAADQYSFGGQMVFFGMMLALGLYNLMLFFSIREASYFWYVLSVGAIAMVQLSISGITFQFIWPNWPALNNFGLAMFIALNISFSALFAYHFLQLRQNAPILGRLTLVFVAVGLVLFCLSPILHYAEIIKLLILTTLFSPIMLLVGVVLWYRGLPQARFYTIAWAFLVLGHVVQALDKFGWWPYSPFSEYAPQIGTAIELLLLSFALSYRFNVERRKRLEAQDTTLAIQKQANEELESKVLERTLALEAANRKLQELSAIDGLTRVKNRHFFESTMLSEWRRNARDGTEIALLMIDADHFKLINDRFGHLCGDTCLQHLATIFQRHVQRGSDFVARYGGEEFAILLGATSVIDATSVAEQIRRAVEDQPLDWDGHLISLSVSVGVAGFAPSPQDDPKELVQEADEALYAAKSAGRNQVMTWNPIIRMTQKGPQRAAGSATD